MELIVFLILLTVLAIFFQQTGLLRSVISLLLLLVCGITFLLFIEMLIQDAALRWIMLISFAIVTPLAILIRRHFYQKQLRWMRESEEWLAKRHASTSDKS